MQTDRVAITVLNPRGMPPKVDKITASAPLSGLQGRKIGILNNMKSGGAALLPHIEEALKTKIPDVELRTWGVPFAASSEEKASRLREKILRRYFLYDRDLLSDLSRCAWESLKLFLQEAVPERNPIPGAVIAIQTFGDFLGFNPDCHVLVTDGCFYGKGMFRVAPPLDLKRLEAIFRHKVFKMLLVKGRITKDLIAMLSNWRHSGFQVFCGQRIFPQDETAMENLARYIIRASFSQERMQYLAEPSKVVYRAKDGTGEKVFDALEWLAAMCSHIPDRGEQMVRY